jgi:hypothetical protein
MADEPQAGDAVDPSDGSTGTLTTRDEASDALSYQPDIDSVQMSAKETSRLSLEDLGEVLRLHGKGWPQRKIAQFIGCSQPSVGYALKRMAGSSEEIQAIAKARATKALSKWEDAIDKAADRGDHRPAREFIELAHADLRPQASNSAGGGGVTIIIGQPGAPVQLPTIELRNAPLSPLNPKALGEGLQNP